MADAQTGIGLRARRPAGPADSGDQRTAEADLTAREQRRREFDIVALEPAVRDRYLEAWRTTQGRFVDDQATATSGSPMAGFPAVPSG